MLYPCFNVITVLLFPSPHLPRNVCAIKDKSSVKVASQRWTLCLKTALSYNRHSARLVRDLRDNECDDVNSRISMKLSKADHTDEMGRVLDR